MFSLIRSGVGAQRCDSHDDAIDSAFDALLTQRHSARMEESLDATLGHLSSLVAAIDGGIRIDWSAQADLAEVPVGAATEARELRGDVGEIDALELGLV